MFWEVSKFVGTEDLNNEQPIFTKEQFEGDFFIEELVCKAFFKDAGEGYKDILRENLIKIVWDDSQAEWVVFRRNSDLNAYCFFLGTIKEVFTIEA